jgi:hypothetical protein
MFTKCLISGTLDIICLCSLAKSTTSVVLIIVKRLRTPTVDYYGKVIIIIGNVQTNKLDCTLYLVTFEITGPHS